VNIVFDLDGTLCNIEHRLHHIQNGNKDWRAFFAACPDDKPIWPLIELCRRVMSCAHVEIWSGRSDEVREVTERWIYNHGMGLVQAIRMRKAGDHRQDNIVKAEWFDSLEPHQRPDIVFDDRKQVVDMWRAKGVICAQVAPGEF
jgi:phosphoglycolate phosphatase-like HAD superfamily hydrolase